MVGQEAWDDQRDFGGHKGTESGDEAGGEGAEAWVVGWWSEDTTDLAAQLGPGLDC